MFFKKKTSLRKKSIVCIGGGTGLFSLLNGLKDYSEKVSIKAIVSTLDSGGSSGKLRTQYGILPPGDIRNCLVALSDETKVLAQLFQYRFDSKLEKHNVGNLLLTALSDITGSFDEAVREASRILRIKGEVIPVSLTSNTLLAKLFDGRTLEGESIIDTTPDKIITKLSLKEKGKSNKRAIEVLKNADLILFGPGDLYTSILPNILFPNVRKAIRENKKAKKIIITPVMSKPGETDNFTVSKFKTELESYLKFPITHILANSHYPASLALQNYQKENKFPILIDKKNITNCILIKTPLIDEEQLLRHNPKRLAKAVLKLI